MCIKNIKKSFTAFFMTLVMVFALAACSLGGNTSSAATEARKNLKDAKDAIVLEHTMNINNVVDDIDLNGVLVNFGAKITWSSSDESHLKIEVAEDGVNYIGKVYRPQASEDNVQVVLTATISVEYKDENGAAQSVSDEKVYTLTITAKEPAETLTEAKAKAAAELAENQITSYATNFYATVSAIMKDGNQFFATDGTTGIYVYVAVEGIKVGDVVNVQGNFQTYYGTLQIAKDGGAVKVLSQNEEGLYVDETGAPIYTAEGPLQQVAEADRYADVAISTLVNQDTADGCFGGQAVQLYGKLVHEKYLANEYENYFVIDPNNYERVLVYYKSINEADEELLAPYLGQYVTINAATYDQKNETGMGIVKRVAIVAESVKPAEAPTLTDEEKLAALLAGLQLPEEISADYTLSADATWKVEEGNAEIVDGVLKVTQTQEEQTIKLSATVTVNELTDTKKFTIIVPSSIIEVLTPTEAVAGLEVAENDGAELYVGGFITADSKLDKYGNMYLEDNASAANIYGSFGKDADGEYLFPSLKEQLGLEAGVYVVIKGTYSNGYKNIYGKEIVSVGLNATDAAAQLADAANDGAEVIVYGTIAADSKLDKYGNMNLEDANGGKVAIYGSFGKDADGNYLFPTFVEQLGIAHGATIAVKGTYSNGYDNISGLEVLVVVPAKEAHEHVYVDGVCECGEKDPDYVTPQPADGILLNVDVLGLGAYGAGTKEVAGVGFEYTELGSFGNGIQWRQKNGNIASLWNTTAIAGKIAKIEFVYNAAKATNSNENALKIEFGTDNTFASQLTYLSTVAEQTEAYVITPDSTEYTYVRLTINITYTMYFDSIKIYFAEGAAEHEHVYGENGKCSCGELDPEHVHSYVEGECACGAEDPDYVAPETKLSTIAEVKAATKGDEVKVQGVVVAKGTESLLIADETGAIMLYKASSQEAFAALEVGAEVEAKGSYSPYNGLHEIASLTSLVALGTSQEVAPVATANAADLEALQCQVIAIELTYVSGTVGAGKNANFEDANGTAIVVRGDSKWGEVAAVELLPGAKVKVIAFVNWYNAAQLTNVSGYTFIEVLGQGHEHVYVDGVCSCGELEPVLATSLVADFAAQTASHSAYTDEWTYGDFTIFGGANNNGGWTYAKFGGKSTNLAKANPVYIQTTEAVSFAAKKVSVQLCAGSLPKDGMSVNSWGVRVYNADGQEVDYVAGGTITSDAGTFEFSASEGKTWEAGYKYRVEFNLANTSTTNGIIWVQSVTIE